MNFENQAWCKCCERPMETVAEIDPVGSSGGIRLVAFICDACGATDTTLVYPDGAASDRGQSMWAP